MSHHQISLRHYWKVSSFGFQLTMGAKIILQDIALKTWLSLPAYGVTYFRDVAL
jgi:hypothetical protein